MVCSNCFEAKSPLARAPMIMWVLVRVIGPVLVRMRVQLARWRQFLRRVRMRPYQMIRMIMTTPQMLSVIVSYQQTLPVMPARPEDVIVLLTLSRLLILAQAIPFTVWMLLDPLSHNWPGHSTIARRFEEEAEVDIHQAIEAELFVDPTHFRQ